MVSGIGMNFGGRGVRKKLGPNDQTKKRERGEKKG